MPIDAELRKKLEQEFDQRLDEYAEAWGESLETHLRGEATEYAEWDESKHDRDHGKFSSSPGAAADETEAHAKAEAIVNSKGILAKIASVPKAIATKSIGLCKSLYAKAEKKYGPRWAKAIVATAIITMPTPVTMGAVGAMTGLAHLWTTFVSGGPATPDAQEKYGEQDAPSKEEVEAAAKELIEELLVGLAE